MDFCRRYHLDESTFILGESRVFFISFLMKIMLVNRIARDGAPRFAASHLGSFCLPMSHKKDAGLHVYGLTCLY